ncbi:cadmium-transporting ATPase [Methylorubrum populi]|uniref:Cadmium-transporting ATPase n=1 Tax=Methylorubrum populi TaxID=223967 RepID=A0A160PEU5_9HYPH|nr:cadmium-transporting ATPase [Methylorubrum populi]
MADEELMPGRGDRDELGGTLHHGEHERLRDQDEIHEPAVPHADVPAHAGARQTTAMRQLWGGRVDERLPGCGAFVNKVATMEK